MFRTFSALLLALGLLTTPSYGVADEWGVLMNDLELFEEALDEDVQLQMEESQDAASEASPDLFPVGEEQEGRIIERARETHISVEIDGTLTTLRDVPRSEWFAPFVEDVALRGIVSGYRDLLGKPLGTFGPADNVTVEQLAKIVIKAAGIDETLCATGRPKNLSVRGSWSELYISCAEARSWDVYRIGNVRVQRSASRGEVVHTVLEAFGIPLGPVTGTVFSDVSISIPFAAAIETASGEGIVSGYADAQGNSTGRFGPYDPVKRAEIAKIVSMALKVYVE